MSDVQSLAESSDEQLMCLLSDGEDDALVELVHRYQNDVFRFSLHYLKNVEMAKEIVQETYLRVYTARDRFDVTRSFKPWLLCIARNLCLNEIKRKKAVGMETLEEYASESREPSGELLHWTVGDAAGEMMANERREALLEAVNGLPEDAREMVMLRYFERLSAREIAHIVDSTEGAVRTRIHRILRQMRKKCQHIWDEM